MKKRELSRKLREQEHILIRLKSISKKLDGKYEYINDIGLKHACVTEKGFNIRKNEVLELEEVVKGKDINEIENLVCYARYLLDSIEPGYDWAKNSMFKDHLEEILDEIDKLIKY